MLALILLLGLPGLVLAEEGDGDVAAAMCSAFLEEYGDKVSDETGNAYGTCTAIVNQCALSGQRGIACFCKVLMELYSEFDIAMENVGNCVNFFKEVLPAPNE